MRVRSTHVLVVTGLAIVLAGCPKKPQPDPSIGDGAAPGPAASSTPTAVNAPPDPAHGKELVLTYQCNRCHDGTGHPAAEQKKHCVHCHKDIMEDRFQAPAASIARWKPRVKELADAPSLEASGKRLSRTWIERYLLQPSDLRPHLAQFMPRLSITPAEARDVAAYLAPNADTEPKAKPSETHGADLGKGRQLIETKGCGSCHDFSGVAAVPSSTPPTMDGRDLERGKKLAPDLRFSRERMNAAKMIAWLQDPKGVKPDTPMPKAALTPTEARDLAAYILEAEITPPPPKPKPTRLPVLARKVTFKEVDEKVFHRTCWHCHSEPDYAIGDGGPGNSGGLGFKPRGLNLSDYNGIAAGYLDSQGERASIFIKDAENVPRVVRALLARYDEENGAETGPVRGMPLGYDPLSLEDIQLVESWVAQGRPR
jgi:cytochrome c5